MTQVKYSLNYCGYYSVAAAGANSTSRLLKIWSERLPLEVKAAILEGAESRLLNVRSWRQSRHKGHLRLITQLSTICLISVATWSRRNIIEILGEVRSQNGVGHCLEH